MRITPVIALAALALVLGAAPVHAAKGADKPSGGGGNLYRYKNDKGVMVLDSSIPPEYASKGYQVITRSGQVVQDVPPVSAESLEEGKRKREQDALNSRRDGDLRKLYSSPQDAERLRNRQMEAITLKIDYTKGQLLQLTGKRKTELEQAARLERKGTPVPAPMKENIDRLNRQVADLDGQVKALEKEREEVRAEFDPIIERLKVIYPDKAAAAAPAPAATPAAAAAPAGTPAVAPAATTGKPAPAATVKPAPAAAPAKPAAAPAR